MTIEKEELVRVAKCAIAGSVASLVMAIWIPAIALLTIEAVAAGGIFAYRRMCGCGCTGVDKEQNKEETK